MHFRASLGNDICTLCIELISEDLMMALSAAIRGITQLLPVIELNDAADQLSTDLARLFPVRNDPIQLTIYVEWLRSKNIGWIISAARPTSR